jgi:hypothetical protein
MRAIRGLALGAGAALVILVWNRALVGHPAVRAEDTLLAPLARLVGGTWVDANDGEAGPTFRFARGAEGSSFVEVEHDAHGAVTREGHYYWHPRKGSEEGSLALFAIGADGEVREGIVREDEPGSIEMRYNALPRDEEGRSLRERIRFLADDRIVRTWYQKTPDLEVLLEERTLVRR